MYRFDKSEILNGSPDKIFSVAVFEMKKKYNKETATNFYNVYKNLPISFILDRSYEIIKEAYFGIDFITNLVKRAILTPYQLRRLYEDCEQVRKGSEEFHAPVEQTEKY